VHPKVSGKSHKEIHAYNNEHSMRSNIKDYGSSRIAIQLHLVAENCTICSSLSRRPVLKLSDTPSYGKSEGDGISQINNSKSVTQIMKQTTRQNK
jgi:hypothetical protein